MQATVIRDVVIRVARPGRVCNGEVYGHKVATNSSHDEQAWARAVAEFNATIKEGRKSWARRW